MKTVTPEQYEERLYQLPEDLRDSILSVDSAHIIDNLGIKYHLHIDQIGDLAEETWSVMMGYTHPTDFVNNLQKALSISRVIASEIASDINAQIFMPVRQLIRELYANRKEEEENGGDGDPDKAIHPSKKALLDAIQNPDNINPMPPAPAKPKEIPLMKIAVSGDGVVPTPTVKPIFVTPPIVSAQRVETPIEPAPIAPNIFEQKMSGQVSGLPPVETRTGTPAKKVDPYKETF